MYRKSVILSLLVLGVLVGSAQAQVISAVAHRNSDSDATELPQVASVPLGEGSVCFVDRTHIYKEVPLSLIGAECIMAANDNKNQGTYELDVTVTRDATIYVLVDNRMGGAAGGKDVDPIITGMTWLTTMGFVDTGEDIGIDESADGSINQYSSVFALAVKRGTYTLGGCTQGHGGNMLGYAVMPRTSGSLASSPEPEDGQTDVVRDIQLRWQAGEGAATRDVYLGVDFADVNNAGPANAVSAGQLEAVYQPESLLDYGQTYYWRIDEINGVDATITKGEVWSFTVETYAYPLAGVTATASSAQADMGPENTINGSGLSDADEHSTELKQMWMTAGVKPDWIQYEFADVEKLQEMWVWNSNQLIEGVLGFGAKDVAIEYSVDGQTWTTLENVPAFAQASGSPAYTANTVVDFGGVMAKYVKLTIDSNWGGAVPQTGLAEVRFFYVPVQAFEPAPAVAAAGVSVDAELQWRPGREAGSHTVYLGADSNAVSEGTVAAETTADYRFTPASLDFATTYFWRVDEVGDAGTYAGDVWSFATEEFAAIDDFEAYNDDDNRIYDAWVDGVTTEASGSQVGYDESPFAEKKTVHGGTQAMPLMYDNTASPYYSEAERTFETPRNLTAHGAQSLSLYYRGVSPSFVQTTSGNILMNGIGTDIWGTSDQFRFAYKSLSGNGSMVARVNSVFNSNTWAKAGVMIRQSTEPGSVHAFMAKTAVDGNGASFQRRLTVAGESANTDAPTAMLAPYWVKIDRTGDKFTAYTSPDGVAWTQLGEPQTIAMTGSVLIGLAVCSHDAAIATGADFSDIQTTGNVTGAWEVVGIGVEQPEGNSPEAIYLTVKDSSGKSKTVVHPDSAATGRAGWQQWLIPLSEFTSAGVKMTAVDSIVIGAGNRTSPTAGGTGILYIDDVGYGRTAGQ